MRPWHRLRPTSGGIRTEPPDPKQPLELTHGNTARNRARGRGARRVFHGTLAAELNDRGAASVEELYLRIDCFLLPLRHEEIRQILESARREGLVAEVADPRDGYGEEVQDEWATTEKGRKLRRPRALALPDLSRLIFQGNGASKLFDMGKTAVTMAIPVLALVGIDHIDGNSVAKWAAFAGVGVVIGAGVLYGLKAEFDLRAAADSWPRLGTERPMRWRYQMSWIRTGYLPTVLACVYVLAGLGLASSFAPVWWYGTASAALVLGAVYFALVLPLFHAWHRDDPKICHEEWIKRGNESARGRAGVPQTYRPPLAPAQSDGGEAPQG